MHTPIQWRLILALMLGFACCAALGCQQEQIQKYRVAKLNVSSTTTPATNSGAGEQTQISKGAVASRMVAAIVQRPEAMWVFKISGPPADISATESDWQAFLEQVSFDESNLPQWKLPAGWTELPGDSFRYKTLTISGAQPPLELAVSRLPPGQDLLMNVNRWRGQLALDPIQEADLEPSLTKLTVGQETFLLFDESGEGTGSMTSPGPNVRPPAATDATNEANETTTSTGEASLPFEFTAPENWEPGPTTNFTLRRFVKTDGSRSAQLAITRLPTATQSWADNVGVWCGELGIPALTTAEVDQQTKEVSIDGRAAKSIALQSAEPKGSASRIVCWTGDSESWFFKLTGEASLVAESQPALDQFLQSIRFKAQK